FFVMLERRVGAMQVTLNLPQSGERPRQISSDPSITTLGNSFNQVLLGVRKPMLSSRLKSLLYKLFGRRHTRNPPGVQ
ncbi:MAG: hypothetical protein WBV60_17165, partial [Terriglobales bacterium]